MTKIGQPFESNHSELLGLSKLESSAVADSLEVAAQSLYAGSLPKSGGQHDINRRSRCGDVL